MRVLFDGTVGVVFGLELGCKPFRKGEQTTLLWVRIAAGDVY